MKKIFFFAFAALTAFFAQQATAQISHGGSPLFNQGVSKFSTTMVNTSNMDNDLFIQEDMDAVKGAGPMRVGIMQELDIDVLDAAKVVKDAEGTHFLLAINSPGASFVSLHFSEYELPEGAELFFYDQTGDVVLGSFVAEDVKEDGTFYTQSIPGSVMYVEYNVPAGTDPGRLHIERICHGYKDIFGSIASLYEDQAASMKGQLGDAEGTCHINVVCSDGDDWRDQIRSVVAIELMTNYAAYMCSGALINNTNQDRTPYILSAYHCQDINGLRQITTYFLYESRNCSNNAGTSITKSVTGYTTRAKAKYADLQGSDFFLYQLTSSIPDSYKPYYAGWDHSSVTPTAGACIHHPGGDCKKISFPRAVQKGTGSYNKYLIAAWYTGTQNKGVTEQGSSGSPLFNADKRIIGQLYAGSSACDYMEGTDLYGRLYTSWTGGGTESTSLQSWLDPTNSGVNTLDGLNYVDPVGIDSPVASKMNEMKVYPNPSNGMVRFDIDALGDANYKVFDLNGRCVMEGRTVLTATSQAVNLSTLKAGTYVLNLYTASRNYSATVIIVK